MYTNAQKEYIESVEYYTRGLEAVSTGICPGCEECCAEYGLEVACECGGEAEEYCDLCDDTGKRPPTMEEFEEQWSCGDVTTQPSFSWSGCDLCGSTLGGDKEVWHGVDRDNNIVHGEYACMDCVFYLANGDIPQDPEN